MGADGATRYSARVELGEQPPAPPAAHHPPPALESWTHGEIYGPVLFHQAPFQVVRHLEGVSAGGMVATVAGLRDAGWPEGPWQTDAAALDGALQVALLWTRHVLGGASLPTSIASVHVGGTPLASGALRCLLRGRVAGPRRALCDIVLLDEEGRVAYQLQQVETHLLPEPSEA